MMTVQIDYVAVPNLDQLALAITCNRAGIIKPLGDYSKMDVIDNYREACRYYGQYFPNMTRADLLPDTLVPAEDALPVVRRLFPELNEDLFCYADHEQHSPLIAGLVRALHTGIEDEQMQQWLQDLEPCIAQSLQDEVVERTRQFIIADEVARVLMPALLGQRNFDVAAQALAGLPVIRDTAEAARVAIALLTELVHFAEYYPAEEDLGRAINYALACVRNASCDLIDGNDIGEMAGMFTRFALKLNPGLLDTVKQFIERLLDGDAQENDGWSEDAGTRTLFPEVDHLPLAG